MESDRRYFLEGLFVIGLALATALFFVWLAGAGHRNDVIYRIHFVESVSGLSLGDSVKYHGVDVGTVEAMALDAADPRRVRVDVKLRGEAPVKINTRASLHLKGLTGIVFIELHGGTPGAPALRAGTPSGQVPEIVAEKSTLSSVLDQLPEVIERLSALEERADKVLGEVTGVTKEVKEDPSVLIWGPKDKAKGKGREDSNAARRSTPRSGPP
ncbi:MAG: MCE family protein [Burkholderiales bacterium]|nr:MCE family protein [Burkholderiales bacterium]